MSAAQLFAAWAAGSRHLLCAVAVVVLLRFAQRPGQQLHDWCRPRTSAGGEFGSLPEPLAALTTDARDVLLTNLGSNGKRLTAEVAVRAGGEGSARWHHIEAVPRRARGR